MKKIIAIILTAMLLVSVLAACGAVDTEESLEPSVEVEETPDAEVTDDLEADEPVDPETDESVDGEPVETE